MNVKDEKYYFATWVENGNKNHGSACFTVHPLLWIREYHSIEANMEYQLTLTYWDEISKEEYEMWVNYSQDLMMRY